MPRGRLSRPGQRVPERRAQTQTAVSRHGQGAHHVERSSARRQQRRKTQSQVVQARAKGARTKSTDADSGQQTPSGYSSRGAQCSPEALAQSSP